MTIKEIHRACVKQWRQHRNSPYLNSSDNEQETYDVGFQWGCINGLEYALEMLESLPEIEPKDRVIT